VAQQGTGAQHLPVMTAPLPRSHMRLSLIAVLVCLTTLAYVLMEYGSGHPALYLVGWATAGALLWRFAARSRLCIDYRQEILSDVQAWQEQVHNCISGLEDLLRRAAGER
jgi:hypothetical protein